jgi:dTDP-4-dehydrorhamnose reductase
MKTLLVTGASGFLGWHICQIAEAAGWQVYGTYFSHAIPSSSSITLLKTDLTDFQALQHLMDDIQPHGVIHTAALSSPNSCQTQPDLAYAINVTASCNLAGLCSDRHIPLAFTSTDLVFDGRNAPYSETDPVNPVNRYGEQKVLAELGMRSRYPTTAICRMPLMFGYAPHAVSFVQPFLKILRSGVPLSLFTDEFRTPVSGTAAARGLLLALETVTGYLHLGGKERVSRYEFGQLMVDVLDISNATITACQQADVPMAAPRPADVSLNSSLAFSLGYTPASLRSELVALRGVL